MLQILIENLIAMIIVGLLVGITTSLICYKIGEFWKFPMLIIEFNITRTIKRIKYKIDFWLNLLSKEMNLFKTQLSKNDLVIPDNVIDDFDYNKIGQKYRSRSTSQSTTEEPALEDELAYTDGYITVEEIDDDYTTETQNELELASKLPKDYFQELTPPPTPTTTSASSGITTATNHYDNTLFSINNDNTKNNNSMTTATSTINNYHNVDTSKIGADNYKNIKSNLHHRGTKQSH
ncbi:uncharacterized protein SCDLUD_003453 [Saccharomycodes ludwigii]|uniref:uncharacterized protein n=1 Tax=Saccharomycodes ludwigii TaxID=36035 RepID=UPI001E850C0F|nr:hypothetical protein SCDLUD_003453 [Saccharomycodes ludwigii]KAH3900468.1 hypothetical protein SCDLUD_003453 [Saccharomycodes ludwigii]